MFHVPRSPVPLYDDSAEVTITLMGRKLSMENRLN